VFFFFFFFFAVVIRIDFNWYRWKKFCSFHFIYVSFYKQYFWNDHMDNCPHNFFCSDHVDSLIHCCLNVWGPKKLEKFCRKCTTFCSKKKLAALITILFVTFLQGWMLTTTKFSGSRLIVWKTIGHSCTWKLITRKFFLHLTITFSP
jgi:hypothetical protein